MERGEGSYMESKRRDVKAKETDEKGNHKV